MMASSKQLYLAKGWFLFYCFTKKYEEERQAAKWGRGFNNIFRFDTSSLLAASHRATSTALKSVISPLPVGNWFSFNISLWDSSAFVLFFFFLKILLGFLVIILGLVIFRSHKNCKILWFKFGWDFERVYLYFGLFYDSLGASFILSR